MRYKSKSISALHIAHRGLPGNMPVRQSPGLERANRERTSGQRRCLPHDLAYHMRVMHRIRWTTAYWFQAQNIGRLKTVARYGLSADYIGFSERELARPDVTALVKNKPHLPTLEIAPFHLRGRIWYPITKRKAA